MDPTTVVPDPTTSPIETLSLVEKLYHSGTFFCLGIVGAFLALRYASKTWGWFEAGGKGAAITAAVLGGLGVLIVPATQGATPNLSMIVTAIGTVVALLMHPITPAKMAKAAGTATILAILMFGCSASQKAAEHAALVCAESAASKDIVPAVESVLTNGLANWEEQLVALGVAYGSDVVNCAVAAAKAELAMKTGAGSGVSSSPIQRADQYLHDHPARTATLSGEGRSRDQVLLTYEMVAPLLDSKGCMSDGRDGELCHEPPGGFIGNTIP